MAGGLRCAVRKQCSSLAGKNERCKVLTKCQQREGSRAGRWGTCIGLRSQIWNVPNLVPVWTIKPIFIFLSLIVSLIVDPHFESTTYRFMGVQQIRDEPQIVVSAQKRCGIWMLSQNDPAHFRIRWRREAPQTGETWFISFIRLTFFGVLLGIQNLVPKSYPERSTPKS